MDDIWLETATTCIYDSSVTATCHFHIWEESQSVTDNKTVLKYRAWIDQGGTQWAGHTRNNPGIVSGWIDGTKVFSEYFPIKQYGSGTRIWDSNERSIGIGHNDDGAKSITIELKLDTGYDDYGHTQIYLWKSADKVRKSGISLPTIARASVPSINTWPDNSPNVTAGKKCTIHMNRKSSSFTHKVYYSFGSSGDVLIGENIKDNTEWTVPTSLLQYIPKDLSGWGVIKAATYSDETKIGENTCKIIVAVPDDSGPVISDIVVTELSDNVKKVASNVTVGQLSNKVVSCKVEPRYYATLGNVHINGRSAELKNGRYECNVSNNSTGSYGVQVKDSRGKISEAKVTQKYYDYSRPQILLASLKRDSETSQNGSLEIEAKYSTVLSNKCTMTIQKDSDPEETIMPSDSGGKLSFSKRYSDLYYNSNHGVTVKLTDSFGIVVKTEAHLGIGTPAIWLGQTKIFAPTMMADSFMATPVDDYREYDPSNTWCTIAEITISGSYVDLPIVLYLARHGDTQLISLTILFSRSHENDPTVSSFKASGSNKGAFYIYKSKAGVWKVLANINFNGDVPTVYMVLNPLVSLGKLTVKLLDLENESPTGGMYNT